MAVYLRELYKDREMLFLFANTGKEKEETLIFLNQLDQHFNLGIVWLEAKVNPLKGKGTSFKVVDFKTASRNGKPFRDVIEKYGLPSKLYRHCTREMKEAPIHKYAKKILGSGYLTAMGIRADEKHRLAEKPNYIYPLAEMNVTKKFINDWWSRQSFNLQLNEHEGNCDFCFLKSKNKRVRLIKDGLNVDWWIDIENEFKTEMQPMFDVRNGDTIEDLVKLAEMEMTQISLLDDVSFDCFCKSY
jgi:hypothetical protein